MASLLLPDDDPAAPAPLLQLPDERPPSLQPDPRADALGQTYRDVTDYMAQKQQESVDQGYWAGGGLLEGGHPTLKAFNSAADEYAQGLLMGTTSPSGKYLKAYHGSPHQFDAFSNDAIGTGEGAQAYGYGHYLAENEGVARGYRDALTPKFIPNPERKAVENEFSFADTASRKAMTGPEADFNAAIATRDAARERLKNTPELIPNPSAPGHMYEVNVAADPEKFLHWDKPLSEQHPDVQDALRSLGFDPSEAGVTGQHVVKILENEARYDHPAYQPGGGNLPPADWRPDPSGASKRMAEAGIPGIRYLDAQSRQLPYQIAQSKQAIADRQSQIADIQADITRNQNNPNLLPRYFAARQEEIAQHQQVINQINERMSEGTHNAVVFDPATMEIIRRYGLAGLMLGGGGLLSPDKQEQ